MVVIARSGVPFLASILVSVYGGSSSSEWRRLSSAPTTQTLQRRRERHPRWRPQLRHCLAASGSIVRPGRAPRHVSSSPLPMRARLIGCSQVRAVARAALRAHLWVHAHTLYRTEFVLWASARRWRRVILLVGARRRRAARTLRVCSRRICRAIPEALVPSSIEFGTASRDFGDLVIGAPNAGDDTAHSRRQPARGHQSDLCGLRHTSNRLESRVHLPAPRRASS